MIILEIKTELVNHYEAVLAGFNPADPLYDFISSLVTRLKACNNLTTLAEIKAWVDSERNSIEVQAGILNAIPDKDQEIKERLLIMGLDVAFMKTLISQLNRMSL